MKSFSEIKQSVFNGVYWTRFYYRSGLGKKLILLNTPNHGNLGDHAIAIATRKFFANYVPEWPVLEFSNEEIRYNFSHWHKLIRRRDVILIQGGGYLGNIWMKEENLVRRMIQAFPNNKIVILPQTVFYTDDVEGKRGLEESKAVYQNHDHLHFCLRDKQSYDFVTNNFHYESAYYLPDMVTYLNDSDSNPQREGVLLCFRRDKEKAVSDEIQKRLEEYCAGCGVDVTSTDMEEERNIDPAVRDQAVNSKLAQFRKSKLVITDRLHAMLFAAITGTPCIAFNNSTRKVSGVYQWIRHLSYIEVLENGEDVLLYMQKKLQAGCAHTYENDQIIEELLRLKKIVSQ